MDTTLHDVYKIIEACAQNKQKRYNIFKVLEIESREVLMCRVLTDFLNPAGAHQKGAKYLKLFLTEILNRDDAEAICSTAHVWKEYPTTQDRRIDIVIQAQDTFIPIEVKIHAGEQKAQCYDYYQFARKKGKTPKVVYLTKWGTMPGSYSMKSADGTDSLCADDIICLSFAEDICKFMDCLMAQEDDAVIKEIASQYKEAIETFTVFVDEELSMKISEKLLESEHHFRSMLAIERAANRTKAALIGNVLRELEERLHPLMERYHFERERRFSWYEYPKKATEAYYKQKESTYPGINYVVKQAALSDEIELWFRVEIDYALFAGFCLFDTQTETEWGIGNQLNAPSEKVKAELAGYLDLEEAVYDGWWVQWWYLPTASEDRAMDTERIPDFKNMNEAAISLVDTDKRNAFIEKAAEAIESRLDRLMLNAADRQ